MFLNEKQIVLLIERMNTSDGPAKIQMSSGRTRFGMGETTNDLVYLFRINYPELFEKRESRDLTKSKGQKNIDMLMQQNGLFDQLLLS